MRRNAAGDKAERWDPNNADVCLDLGRLAMSRRRWDEADRIPEARGRPISRSRRAPLQPGPGLRDDGPARRGGTLPAAGRSATEGPAAERGGDGWRRRSRFHAGPQRRPQAGARAMTIRMPGLRNLCLSLLLMAIVAAGVGSVLRARLGTAPRLDGLAPLIKARRFDEAEARLREFLRVHPGSLQANLLMAQVALDRDDQKPQLALDHLARIKARDRGTRAMVLLNEGKAYSALGQNDRAEAAWKEALRLEPRIPEAGWALLSLYYVQGRREDGPPARPGTPRHRARPSRSRATAPGAGPPGRPDRSARRG